MKKYIVMAAAVLALTSPSQAQQRIDGPVPTQGEIVGGEATSARTGFATAAEGGPLKVNPAPVQELSPWSMYLSADPLVKAVIISLALASLVTWTIFLAKAAKLKLGRWQLNRSLGRISVASTLSEAQFRLGPRRNVLGTLLAAATQEIRMSTGSASESIKERASSRFSEIARTEARAVREGMVILATISSTAPFVGLFGTVWGIMNSFIGISKSQTTNLAVVAPGIAEALLATACGLAAAIPAVIFYNQLTRSIRGYLDLVGRASGAVGRLVSRDVDRLQVPMASRAAE